MSSLSTQPSSQAGDSHASSSSAKPSTSNGEERWTWTREHSVIPSEPSTPAAHPAATEDPMVTGGSSSSASRPGRRSSSSRTARSRTGSLADSIGASSALGSSTSGTSNNNLNIDAEDEDVKIAIMALGAMKHLDGRSRSNSEDTNNRARVSSSSRSVSSTGMSSPTSTPQLLHGQSLVDSASGGSMSTASSTPATLADLPPDFQFPAIVHDEYGNEMRVEAEDMADADFLKRVSHLPIVRGTLRAYELGKQRSRVMKYGGNLVESSVKAIGGPVVSRIGARLGGRGVEQLDDFACRQLDRIYPNASKTLSKEEKQAILGEVDEKEQKEWQNMSEEERARRRQAYISIKIDERIAAQERNRSGNTSPTKTTVSRAGNMDPPSTDRVLDAKAAADRQAIVRAYPGAQTSNLSGWSSMLVGAGATAGGLSAAMSEESMKSLKYCLQWLQYATARIENQITILRDLIVKLNHGELDLSSPAADNLSAIKGDVVGTIRGVVEVVGKYAGGALPEPARGSVKAFILSLPARWASVNRAPQAVEGRRGSFGGSPASPSFSSAHMSGGQRTPTPGESGRANSAARQQAAATAAAANRVLTLAVESLDILRSVTVVFGESLDRADIWVERLRVLGLQRKRAHAQAAAEEAVARIDDGMGGALARGHHWESARGMRLTGSESPGAESNMSTATNASTKRRKTRGRGQRMSNGGWSNRGLSPNLPSGDEDEDNGSESADLNHRHSHNRANASSVGIAHNGAGLAMRRGYSNSSTTGKMGSNGTHPQPLRRSEVHSPGHAPGHPTPLMQQLSVADGEREKKLGQATPEASAASPA